MMNRKCITCGAEYSYCPNCGSGNLTPYWKSQFCSEDCKQIWDTCTQFNFGSISKAQAKSVLSLVELKSSDQYVKCVQRDLDVILKEDIKNKRGKRALIMPIDDAMVSGETEDEVVEQEKK